MINDNRKKILAALDIETEAIDRQQPDHALIPHLSRITCVGVYSSDFHYVFRSLGDLKIWIEANPNVSYVGHNFKFDLRHLYHHGVSIPLEQWAHDTQLMASQLFEKIPEDWIENYEVRRKEANKKLKKGFSHRKARGLSLKTLAPYFLKVDRFWEDPSNHDNDSYVLKDCRYTYDLCLKFYEQMQAEGTLKFYQEKLLPWTKMLFKAENRGIKLNTESLVGFKLRTEIEVDKLKTQIDRVLEEANEAYYNKQLDELKETYNQKKILAIEKLKAPTDIKLANVQARYAKLCSNAIETIPQRCNLDSPSQLLWILKDFLKLDTTDFNGYLGTGIEVLEKLKGRHTVIDLLIQYREKRKLTTAFFPTYLELQERGILHTNYKADGTRTGRLSSSEPNLQQVPGGLHSLFVARPGYSLITKDMSAIEPHLIAYYSEDPELYMNVKEFHAANVRILFNKLGTKNEIKKNFPVEYALAKEVGLACLYGAGAKRIRQSAQKYGVEWRLNQCRDFYYRLKESYETTFEFKLELDKKAAKGPFNNLFGRPISFKGKEEDIYMQAFNTLIQGSASDLVLSSAYRIMNKFKELEIDGHCLLWVHDELVIEVNDKDLDVAESVIETAMTSYDLPTPMGPIKLETEGRIAKSWSK